MRAAALVLALTACSTGRAMPTGRSHHDVRAPNMAAFLILANGHGRGLVQWASATYSSPLLEAYDEWAVFEPRRGRLLADEKVYRALLRRIERAARRRDAVDLFIFAHDNEFWLLLDDLPPEVTRKIRLVYNAGCNGARQYQRWLDRGVQAYVGHPDDSCSHMFVHYFQTPWWYGMPLHDAVGEANHAIQIRLLDPSDMFGKACRMGKSGESTFKATAAQIAGNGAIRIDTPVR